MNTGTVGFAGVPTPTLAKEAASGLTAPIRYARDASIKSSHEKEINYT
jgi:hypothetical protein